MQRNEPFKYVFLFIGWPKSGKKLAGQLFSHAARVTHAATSAIIYEELARERGVRPWELEALDKTSLVPELVRVGNALCSTTPTALVAPLLKRGVRVISGVRRRVELAAARSHIRECGFIPVVVWMDRKGAIEDNTEVGIDDADWVIRNHSSVGYLAERVAELSQEFQVDDAPPAEEPRHDGITGASTTTMVIDPADPAGCEAGFDLLSGSFPEDEGEDDEDETPPAGSPPKPSP